MVKEILLGDNPLIGVSHLSQEKARAEYEKTLDLEMKTEILKAALEGGATGFTFSTHQSNLELLKYVKTRYPGILENMNYYILTPYAMGYVRRANIYGTVGLVKTVVRDIIFKYPAYFIESVITIDVDKLASLFIGLEAKPYIEILPREKIKAILLHEVITELIVAYDLTRLLHKLKRYVENKLEIGFGLETRNILQLKRFLNRNGIQIDYIMTPMNPLGYQMAPSKEEAEKTIQELREQDVKIIGINILASGAVSIEETCKYLEKFKDYIYAVAYGTSKSYRAKKNAMILKNCLY